MKNLQSAPAQPPADKNQNYDNDITLQPEYSPRPNQIQSEFDLKSYYHPHNKSTSDYSFAQELRRQKRGVERGDSKMRTTCNLHIRTDPTLWRYISKLASQVINSGHYLLCAVHCN
jgi:hypothetical protein